MKLDGFPDYVKDYHEKVASQYDSPQLGNRVAWEAVKYRLTTHDKQVVAQRENFEASQVFKIDLQPTDKKIVTQADDGSFILDAVLATTETTKEGQRFTREALEKLADRINENGIAAPEIDTDDNPHEEFMNVAVSNGFDPDAIRDSLSNMRGMLENVRASVKDGKLWLQAKLDEAFKSVAESFENVSIEALADVKPNGIMEDPDPLGFIFTNRPKDPNAQVAV